MREIKKYVRYYIIIRSAWPDKNPERPRNVVLNFGCCGKRLTKNTGIKVAPCDWDKAKQRVKLTVKRAQQVNNFLNRLEEQVNDIYFNALGEGIPPTSLLILDGLRKIQNPEPIKTFWDYYNDYLDTHKMVIKHSSYKTIVTSAKRFKEFCKSEGKLNIKFEEVTPSLLAHYTDFLLRRGNTNNTIHSQLKRLRRFMNHSRKLNLHKSETYKEYDVPERVSVIKFLEWGEVKQLMAVQLDSIVEQRARDIFLFACFTGMRFSDIKALKKADIKQHQFEGIDTIYYAAHIRQQKTSRDTIVPLLPEAISLIRLYEDLPGEFAFPKTHLQKVNDALKDVGKKAGLNALQKIEIYKGSGKETKYLEKWRVLSTHTGRRTFVTISATKGLPINVVASITGQNPTTTMKHYMGVVNVEKFRELTNKVKFQ